MFSYQELYKFTVFRTLITESAARYTKREAAASLLYKQNLLKSVYLTEQVSGKDVAAAFLFESSGSESSAVSILFFCHETIVPDF